MHFGLEPFAGYILYVAGVLAFVLSVCWRPIVGIYYLVPLIPLQTARYALNGLPLGQSLVEIILLGVLLGLVVRGEQILPKTSWNLVLSVYAIFTFVSLCMGSLFLGSGLPISLSGIDQRMADWTNYMTMPLLLFLTAATVRETRQMKTLILLMCAATLLLDRSFWDTVSGRDFSAFSYDLQDESTAGYAGVNGMAAFMAEISVVLLALAVFERKRLLKSGYLTLFFCSAICLMYSLSREAYLAFLAGCLFVGLMKQRKVLVLLAVLASTWSVWAPRAVVERVEMTYDKNYGQLDHSSQVRVDLWEEGLHLFEANPLLGQGFDTYAYTKHVHGYGDSHNIYVKVLVETGIIGLLLFLWLMAKTFWAGYQLFRRAQDPFLSSIGLGLAAWMVCATVVNFFGDRWTFLQIDGYMWVLAGLVAQAWVLEQRVVLAADRAAVGNGDLPNALEPQATAGV